MNMFNKYRNKHRKKNQKACEVRQYKAENNKE